MEMLAVLFIIGLLAMLVLGITSHAQRVGREARARADMELIRNALQEYMLKIGTYPEAGSWTNSAVTNWLPTGFSFNDPWGTVYQYTNRSAESYSLYSMGQRTNDPSDDIVSGR